MAMVSNTADKTCVVVGGGMSGQSVARELVKRGVAVTIIQSNPFYENPVTMPYYLTRPTEYESTANSKNGACSRLEHFAVKGAKYVIGTATSVNGTAVVMEGGTVPFDALVLAVGNYYPAITADEGEDFATRLAFVKDFPGKVAAAKSILVGGTGPVALEMVSELRRLNAGAKITAVTSGGSPLGWEGTAGAKLAARLQFMDITIIQGARIESTEMSFKPTEYALSTGVTVQADIFLPYFGTPRTGFVDGGEIPLAKRGRVKVNDYGQSLEAKSVFAVGCSDKYQAVLAPTIAAEAEVVATNVQAFLRGASMSATLPEKNPAPANGIVWIHLGLGQWSAMNLALLGPGPALCGRCCGCFNPLCPCAACCGWPCMFPASECSGKCFGKMLTSMKVPGYHQAVAPDMVEMTRT